MLTRYFLLFLSIFALMGCQTHANTQNAPSRSTKKTMKVADVQVQDFKINPIKNGIHLSFKLKNNRAEYLSINKVAACVATLNTDRGSFQGYMKPKIVAPSEECIAEVSFPHAKGKIQGLSLESIIIANKDGVQTEKSQPIKIKVPVNMVTG